MIKPTALIFSGQGAQHVGMGSDLVEAYPDIGNLYDQADKILSFPLKGVCFEGPDETLTGTDYCQPALFVHGLALLKLLQKLLPDFTYQAVAGLSLGEFTAHTAAGTFSFEEGLKLVAERGRLMQLACRQSEGGMVSLIGGTHEQAEEVAEKSGLQVANYNCPGQVVLSGAKDRIPVAAELAKEFGFKKAFPLNVAGAYHSRLMQPAQDQLKPFIEKAKITNHTHIIIASNVTGLVVEGEDEIRDTLLRQVTGSVRWENCIHTLLGVGVERFIEMGPGKVLQGLCRRIDKNINCLSIGNLEELEAALYEIE